MAKNMLFIIILVLSGLPTAYGQDTSQPLPQRWVSPKFMADITGGVTIPMGNFAKADYFNAASGFAGNGANGGITATYFINKHWGMAALFSYQQFSFSPGNLNTSMVAYPGGFGVDSAHLTVKGDNHAYNFLIGPVYTLQVGEKLSIDIRLLGGFINANLAGNTIVLTDVGVTQAPFYQAVSSANTFGGQVGAALRYRFSEHFGASANVDFFYSKPGFTVNNVDRTTTSGREIFSYDQPVEGINANLSVYYMLDKKYHAGIWQ